MKIIDHISKSKKTLFSIEILPPKKGEHIKNLYESIDILKEFGISFIDVTYHREEYINTTNSLGEKSKIAIRKRPGTVAICAAIQAKYQIDAVPHMICGGFTKEDTENALIDLNFLDIDNVLLLRGDPPKGEEKFEQTHGGHLHAIDLIEQVNNLNQGNYLNNYSASPTHFCIGVAGYPEKHFESPSLEADVKLILEKQKRGAGYVVTQLFYDNQSYFDFVSKCRDAGIVIPIIPGLKPLATKEQLSVLPNVFHIKMPEALRKEVEKCKDNTQVKEVGVEWCIKQCKELIAKGVPVLHFYTMSKADMTKRVAEKIF